MNKQHEALYDAITGIDAEYIEESTKPPRRTRNRILQFAAAAAVLALLLTLPGLFSKEEKYVTAPGMLAIRAYAVNSTEDPDMNGTVMEEGIDFPYDYVWGNGTNIASGIPIYLSIADESIADTNISWEIRMEDGLFQKSDDGNFHPEDTCEDYLGRHFTVPNNTMLLWSNIYYAPELLPLPNTPVEPGMIDEYIGESTYVEAIVRSDGHIIGYAVIEILGLPSPLEGYEQYGICCFAPKLVAANYYPKVNGEFQEITEEYILQQIANVTGKQ